MELPNSTTQQALADAEARKNLTTYGSTTELFADLGIGCDELATSTGRVDSSVGARSLCRGRGPSAPPSE